MTQSWIVIALLEALLVSAAVSVALLVVHWRAKRRRRDEIEELLAEIEDRQDRRADRQVLSLIEKYRLDETSAQNAGNSLMAAEKQFLYYFVEQQLQQQSLDGFYERLCVLLDDYLEGVLMTSIPQADKAETVVPSVVGANPDQDPEQPVDAPPPPDWGDVFD